MAEQIPGYKTHNVIRLFSDPSRITSHFNTIGESYYMRRSRFMTCVVSGKQQFMYPNAETGFSAKMLWIFGAVKKCAEQWLQDNPHFEVPTEYPTNAMNYDYDDTVGTITGTDITGAYWTIAHNLGIISTKLYEKCRGREFKVVRLAALAVLGRAKTYDEMQDGRPTGRKMVYPPNQRMKDIYRTIRYVCFAHMQDMAKLLGNDFDCYKTDAIYYRDTPENREKVYDYLKKADFEYSQLVFKAEPADLEDSEL